MINSTASGDERDQRSRWTPEPPVDVDAGRERQHPGADASAKAIDRARSVALEGEDVLAGLKDRLDPLADRGEVGTAAGLIAPRRPKQGRAEACHPCLELGSRVALVADHGLTESVAASSAPAISRSPTLAGASAQARGVPSAAKAPCRRIPQKCREWLWQ